MTAQVIHPFAYDILIFVVLLAGALIVGVLADRMKIPYTVALVAAGLAVSFDRNLSPFDFGGGLLFLFLPPLLFEAAWNLRLDALRRTWKAIAWLAAPGVLITLVIIAGVMAAFGSLPWPTAFVLGAIVSATDPVAVIATFRRVRVPIDLQTIVEGESLANDGVAAVLTATLVAFAQGVGGFSPPLLVFEAIVAVAGGVVIGVLCAYAVALLVRDTANVEMEMIGTILVAYGSYILADGVHVSGIFATISAGIVLRALAGVRSENAEITEQFWGVVAFLANSLVFLLMGLTVQIDQLIGQPLFVIGAVSAALLSRFVVAYGMPSFGEIKQPRWHHVIALAGMRGGLAIALALSLPSSIAYRSQIIDGVFAIVLFTVLVQGLAIGPAVEHLKVTAEA